MPYLLRPGAYDKMNNSTGEYDKMNNMDECRKMNTTGDYDRMISSGEYDKMIDSGEYDKMASVRGTRHRRKDPVPYERATAAQVCSVDPLRDIF